MLQIPFRTDNYGRMFYIETEHKFTLVPYRQGLFREQGLDFHVSEHVEHDVLQISIQIQSKQKIKVKRLGFRLGIDTYMEKYPDWNERYFPTAMRCEKRGFWSCFMSPLGKIVSVCSPSKIISWRHEYARTDHGDVGHRIFTSSVDFINTYPNPKRHPKSRDYIDENPLCIELYFACPQTESDMYQFIEKYANIHIPVVNKYTLEPNEPLLIDGKPFAGTLQEGLNIVNDSSAEMSVFVRKDWFYYLDAARKSAELCQQKPGTHCESWYGYFSRVLYANVVCDDVYTRNLCKEFDAFFQVLTERKDGRCQMKEAALPHRLQNISSMISLLADFYELTGKRQYLDDANDFAEYLMSLQEEDGSYRNKNIHYTCVIYPAKSMLELALVERKERMEDRYHSHFVSAYRAIKNLELLLDNIETEGQMTFEDGMISCECLQLAFLALLLPDGTEKKQLTDAAAFVLQKHRCLEQQFLPDCRVRGCTTRFWEARYDLNFFANMLNMPHGWTSWKTYATFYLYLLTEKLDYLKDTMDTLGACMQCVDENGVLHWGYVADPCVIGERLLPTSTDGKIETSTSIVGECYLPMISDWWRQEKDILKKQYLSPVGQPDKWHLNYGGSCDNDVHEHFKCLMETVFGRAFIHETEDGYFTYNCEQKNDGFICSDMYLKEWFVYVKEDRYLLLNGEKVFLRKGMNIL